jgi:glycopeptide antibiotics resistance protein
VARLGPADVVFGTVLLLIVALSLVLAHRRAVALRRLLVLGIFCGYLIVLAMIILCPLPGPPPLSYDGDRAVELLQFETELDLRGLLSSGLDNQDLQNLVLGVPFGFGLPWVLRCSSAWLVGACLLLGVGLEGAQAVASLLAGWAYRSIDINDLLANDAGALLGLLVFALVNWRFLRRPGPAGRTAAIGTPVAACLAAVALLAGPRPAFVPARVCETTPATAVEIQGYSVFPDHDMVCLTHPHGFTALRPGDKTPFLDLPDADMANVVGLAPLGTARVQAVLSDGQRSQATPRQVAGLTDWLVYVASVKPTGADTLTVTVELLAADGSILAEIPSAR